MLPLAAGRRVAAEHRSQYETTQEAESLQTLHARIPCALSIAQRIPTTAKGSGMSTRIRDYYRVGRSSYQMDGDVPTGPTASRPGSTL
jgi:hypothetical protein